MSDGLIYLQGDPESLQPIIMQIMAFHQYMQAKDVGTIYADASASPPVRRRGRPKIVLYFQEQNTTQSTRRPGTYTNGKRVPGEISFRLMDETPTSIGKTSATALGQKIKEIFGSTDGYKWEKGKTMYTYTDWDKGYQLQILSKSKAEAKRLITDTLKLQSHTPDFKNFRKVELENELENYPTNPGSKLIMGDTIQLEEQRPIVDVRFQYAYMVLEGRPEPVVLYDRTNTKVDALVR